MPAAITYVLGKDCVLEIDDEEIKGVSDVSVRESVTEIDASGFGRDGSATVVVGRTYEIMFSVPDIVVARKLFAKRFALVEGDLLFFYVPRLVKVGLTGGVWDIDGIHFTIHGTDGDQPLNDAVVARFELRQWNNSFDEVAEIN
jgi:hypothetical protein